MAVKVMKRNGDIQVIPNAEFLPAFYFIPEIVLKKCGKDAMRLPRCPRKLLLSNKAIRYVSSDHFLEVIIDAYAYMIWPHMWKYRNVPAMIIIGWMSVRVWQWSTSPRQLQHNEKGAGCPAPK